MAVVVAFMGVVIAFMSVCFFIYRQYIEQDRLKRRKKRIEQIINKKIQKTKKMDQKNLTVDNSRWVYVNRLGSIFSCSFVPLVWVSLCTCMLVGVA